MKKTIFAVLALSLVILILPSCAAPIPSMPPVTDTGETYTHEKAGFSITFPQEWTVLDSQQIQDMSAQTIEMLKASYKDPAEFQKAIEQNVPVAVALLHPQDYADFNPNLNIIIMAVPSLMTGDMVSFAKKTLEEMSKQFQAGVFEQGEVVSAKIGGLDGAVADMKQTQLGFEVLQRQYYVSHNNRLVVITLSASDAAGLDTLQKAVDNVRFK